MAEPKQTVLLLDDDANIRHMYESALSGAGYRVLAADKVAIAWNLFLEHKPDLAILDIMLPDGTGVELCEKIREHKTHGRTPVILMTVKPEFEMKASGFKAGADQYLLKPVPPNELLLWVEALLRRLVYDKEEGDLLIAGDCRIDLKARIVTYKGQSFSFLTNKEFDLLYYLVKKRPQVISRKQILSNLWHTIAVDHVVNNHVNNLRRKLPQELADKIQTVPGKGFRYLE